MKEIRVARRRHTFSKEKITLTKCTCRNYGKGDIMKWEYNRDLGVSREGSIIRQVGMYRILPPILF